MSPRSHNDRMQFGILRRILWLALLFTYLALAGELPVQVVSVALVGAKLPVNLATQAGQPYDARAIQKDIRALWDTGRLEDIRVETIQAAAGTAVAFHVTEAPHLSLHEVRISPSSFGLHPKLATGTPMDQRRAHEVALEARRRLIAEGYVNARVDYDLLPVSAHAVDLRLTVRAGDPVDVSAFEIRGDPGLGRKELLGALRAMRIRRVLPGVPGLWRGWTLYPAYSSEAVESDLGRLHSLYLSNGYFDASVNLHGVEIHRKAARVTIDVQPGPSYHVRQWAVSGAQVHPENTSQFCSCLFARRRQGERQGILDFSVKLNVVRTDDGFANLTAAVEEGRAYRVGRIEFSGNRHYTDAAVRRNFLLDEGQPLDQRLLRQSIARLDQTMQFEPVGENAIVIERHPETADADVTVRLTERKPRAWAISGPLGTVSFAGPLQASLSSRLPPWGQGLFELSTYTASVSLFAFAHPLLPFLSTTAKGHFLPVLALQRPFTPGEGWKSGFVFAPHMGWRSPAFSYATTQLHHRLLTLLAGDRARAPELQVTVERPTGDAMLFCEPPRPRFAILRSTALMGIRLLGALPAL